MRCWFPQDGTLGTGTFPGLGLPGDQRGLEHVTETQVLTWMRLHDPREPLADPAGPAINSTGDWLLGRSFYLLFQTAIVMYPRDKKATHTKARANVQYCGCWKAQTQKAQHWDLKQETTCLHLTGWGLGDWLETISALMSSGWHQQ